MADELIHLVDVDAPINGRQRRAVCGEWVEKRHGLGTRATCADCLRLDAENEAAFKAMTEEDL